MGTLSTNAVTSSTSAWVSAEDATSSSYAKTHPVHAKTPPIGAAEPRAQSDRDDRYADLRPPCGGEDCDTYANIYLNGDPDDQNFDSGDQGFNMLMEEAFQYVNSLATNYALNERYQGSISGRDGILTTLWWVQRYLAKREPTTRRRMSLS